MKQLYTILALFFFSGLSAQVDFCSGFGAVPSITVGATCSTTAYTIPSTFADNFTSEPPCGTSYIDGFMQFTAIGSSTTINVSDATAAGANPGVMILSGTCGGTLTVIGCSQNANGTDESVTVSTTAGTTYFIVIFGINNAGNGAPATFSGTICAFTPPVGSNCQTAENLPLNTTLCNTNSYAGSFNDAGGAPGNPCSANYNDGEYWYQVTGTGQALNIALSSISALYSGIFVLDGCPGSGTSNCIANAIFPGTTANYSVNTPVLTNGQTYYIGVVNWASPYSVNFCITSTVTTPPVVASDCQDYVNVCTDIGFQIDPNGSGLVNDIPPLGTTGNPAYGGLFEPNSPWGGGNDGCLRVGESNSTWMVVNISGSGSLNFTFGGNGTQAGFYDWIMYPYTGSSTCANIAAGSVAPVRCNWNGSSTGGTGLQSTIPAGGSATNFEPPLNVTAGQQYIICFSNYSSTSSNVPLQFGGTATVSCTPLGPNLIDFNLETNCTENTAALSWRTINNSLANTFYLQQSLNGSNWEAVQITPEVNNEQSNEAYFRIVSTLKGTGFNYFRVLCLDINGEASYSDIKSAICAEQIENFSLAPNPTAEITNLTYSSKTEGQLFIIDGAGRTMSSELLPNTYGKLVQFPINVSQFKQGFYRISLEINGESKQIAFIKI